MTEKIRVSDEVGKLDNILRFAEQNDFDLEQIMKFQETAPLDIVDR